MYLDKRINFLHLVPILYAGEEGQQTGSQTIRQMTVSVFAHSHGTNKVSLPANHPRHDSSPLIFFLLPQFYPNSRSPLFLPFLPATQGTSAVPPRNQFRPLVPRPSPWLVKATGGSWSSSPPLLPLTGSIVCPRTTGAVHRRRLQPRHPPPAGFSGGSTFLPPVQRPTLTAIRHPSLPYTGTRHF